MLGLRLALGVPRRLGGNRRLGNRPPGVQNRLREWEEEEDHGGMEVMRRRSTEVWGLYRSTTEVGGYRQKISNSNMKLSFG